VTIHRRSRLWQQVVEQANGEPISLGHVCTVISAKAGVNGVAVTVVLDAQRETVYASGAAASTLEELVLTLGEGPAVDAFADGGVPVLVADLSDRWSTSRWPVFVPAAADAGVGAVFVLPLGIGAIRVGVLSMWRTEPGGLDGERLADALALADTACLLLLDGQHRSAFEGAPAATGQYPQVHQATGMVSVQLGVTPAEALIRLRAYAYAHDQPLHDVATDVISRRLAFDPDGEGGLRGQ
jgi:ANTAR domain